MRRNEITTRWSIQAALSVALMLAAGCTGSDATDRSSGGAFAESSAADATMGTTGTGGTGGDTGTGDTTGGGFGQDAGSNAAADAAPGPNGTGNGGDGSWGGDVGTSDGGTGAGGDLEPGSDGGGAEAPACTGKQCGPDGSGGSCGFCSSGDSCQGGVCVDPGECTPMCAGQMIGVDDGCGGVCSGSGMGIGLVPGGAQDAAYYESLVWSGEVPEPELLPIEGWLTQHGTSLPAPKTDRLVTLHGFAGLFYDPELGDPTVALQLGLNSGLSPEAIEEGQFNLSVVIDRSGSMQENDKIDFLKEGLIQMLDVLDGGDILSIVSYSTTAKVELEPTAVTDENREFIKQLILDINTGGKTNLQAGLKLGYEQVMKNAAQNQRTPRVMLLSDGIVNTGVTDTDAILAFSSSYNGAGIGLTTIGVGQDLQFDLMHLLATQGNGNFYFIEDADKLTQVFQEEIEFLLTPVADNLQIWFTLPNDFGVEDVYGFEYAQSDGEFHLLGPSPQYTVSGGEIDITPPPSGEEPQVAVSTLFASKKNGLLMIKLTSPGSSALAALENLALANVYYSYELIDSQTVEAFDVPIQVGSMEYDTNGGFQFFSGAIMQRNFCILRAGLAMRTASTHVHTQGDEGIPAAIAQLAQARTFCTGINVQLSDPRIDEDVALMTKLMDNVCGEVCLDPDAQ